MPNRKPVKPKSIARATKAVTNPDTYRLSESVDGIKDGMSDSQMLAALASRGALAPTSIKQFSNCGEELQISDVLAELQKAGGEVSGGNLERVERLLVNQAITLDTLFHNLLQRAGRQEYMKNLEIYMRLALKAQAQARSTAEALGMLKNPAPYIKQANIAAGHQQVNNHTYASASPHTRAAKSLSAPNKLMGASNGEWLDTGATGQAGRSDQAVGTVEAIDRSEIVGRQSNSIKERVEGRPARKASRTIQAN